MTNIFKNVIKSLAVFIDFLLIPLVIFAISIMIITRRLGIHRLKFSKFLYFKTGVFPVTSHYYDPFFSLTDISQNKIDRKLPGIQFNTESQLSLLKSFKYSHELTDLPVYKIEASTFHWDNGSFESGDAEAWYNLIRLKKPKVIIEIGSGYSTLLAIEAIEKNMNDNDNYFCEHICIEPYEMSWLETKNIKVIRQKVEDVDISIFNKLQNNDFLFVDSSHMIKRNGDVLHEYLQILPQLNNGVIVHVHDIFSPNDYPYDWVSKYMRFWNEQYLFEAFLTNNSEWSTLLSLNYLHHNYFSELLEGCLCLVQEREPGSFYIQKK